MRYKKGGHEMGRSKAILLSRYGWAISMAMVLGADLVCTGWIMKAEGQKKLQTLITEARLVANAINVRYITDLTGSSTDLALPSYQRLKEQLSLVRSAQPEYRFLYLMGRRTDGTVFFYVDSEPAGSKDDQFVDVNKAWQDLTSYTREEAIGHTADELILHSVLDKLEDPRNFLKKVDYLSKHRDETSQEELVLKGGRILDRYSSPMKGPDGTYYGRVWYFRDITERKRAEQALRQANERIEAIHREMKEMQSQVVRGEKPAEI